MFGYGASPFQGYTNQQNNYGPMSPGQPQQQLMGPYGWQPPYQPSVSANPFATGYMQGGYQPYPGAYAGGSSVPSSSFTSNNTFNNTFQGQGMSQVPGSYAQPTSPQQPQSQPQAPQPQQQQQPQNQGTTITGPGGGPMNYNNGGFVNTPIMTGQGTGNSMLNPNNSITAFQAKYGTGGW